MSEKKSAEISFKSLKPYLSPMAAWALAVGTSVGWGSLVVTSSDYLSQAGPLGSICGLLIGGAIMLLAARNFHYMANRYPDAGGVYTYTKNVFGYDRAFLVSWFLSLTYISMFWANATSLPLFARYFLNNAFRFGYLYTVFGYDVYLGETLLTLFAVLTATYLCIKSKEAAAQVMIVFVLIFTIGISACFLVAMLKHGSTSFIYDPSFIPDRLPISQIIHITMISPWAFIGFENITHSSEEYNFRISSLYKILFAAVITTTALYLFVILLSVSAYPAGCSSWLDYISRLNEFSSIEGLPAFYAADYYMGSTGIHILMACLLALVLTSLIGNLRALSRLFYAVSRDGILPERFAQLNEKDIPANAMLLVAALSLIIPFLGRTTIGWIVDITTLGSTVVYGFVAAAAYKTARGTGDKKEIFTGGFVFAVMIIFAIYLLFPNLFTNDTLATETYILVIIWSILGFFYFRRVIAKDHARRFGKAIIVWISILALIIMMTMIWSGRMEDQLASSTIETISSYYNGTADPSILALDENTFISKMMSEIRRSNTINSLIVIGLFTMGLTAMLINHFSLRKWENKATSERDKAYEVAYKDPLTGVKSKHAYVEQEREIAETIYKGEAKDFAVVVCDVNGLKYINDTLGHKAGDNYIRAASDLICEYYKHSPVYRIGGDEFAVVLQGSDFDNRHEIMRAINEEIESNLGTGKVVASLGLADFDPVTDNTFHAVFTKADNLMYERKQQLKSMGAITRD